MDRKKAALTPFVVWNPPQLRRDWSLGVGDTHLFVRISNQTCFWLAVSTHLKKIVKLDHSPNRDEDKNYLKPPSRNMFILLNIFNTPWFYDEALKLGNPRVIFPWLETYTWEYTLHAVAGAPFFHSVWTNFRCNMLQCWSIFTRNYNYFGKESPYVTSGDRFFLATTMWRNTSKGSCFTNGVTNMVIQKEWSSKDGDSCGRPTMGNKKRNTPGDSK